MITGLDELGQQCRAVRQAIFMLEGHLAGGVLSDGVALGHPQDRRPFLAIERHRQEVPQDAVVFVGLARQVSNARHEHGKTDRYVGERKGQP